MLEHHPVVVRKKIALGITFGVMLILLALMIVLFERRKDNPRTSTTESRFLTFYATILSAAQSRFSGNSAIIKGQ